MRLKVLFIISLISISLLSACGAAGAKASAADSETNTAAATPVAIFDADSAYGYVARQVEFGPRVPNTEPHRKAAVWLADELRRHGAEVALHEASLKAFDGTNLNAVNILGQFNPSAQQRILLVAHWDCRPWADQDIDKEKHTQPVDGANDGASGVGVLLEIARHLGKSTLNQGVDILFVDAEDWGSDGDEDSWALGAKHFVDNYISDSYRPTEVIVLDMVGGNGARFPREYFSQQAAPALLDKIYSVAAASGYGDIFVNEAGGAVTDDHLKFIEGGIPAVDIIDYRNGFHPAWHTSGDNMEVIDSNTLKAVGQTMLNLLLGFKEQ